MTMTQDQLLSLTVAEIMARWPHSVPVFLFHRLDCVGCPMAPFETLAEVIAVYDLPSDVFLHELLSIIQESPHLEY